MKTRSLLGWFWAVAAAGGLAAQTVSFVARRDYPAGTSPQSVAVADFNGDSKPDVAVVNRDSRNVSVLLGNGDGSLQPARHSVAGAGPRGVATADFNGDGRLDLAVLNYYVSHVSVLLGNGDGTFQAPSSFSLSVTPSSLLAGDFNGDTIPDLVVLSEGEWLRSIHEDHVERLMGAVSILRGVGDGSFTAPENYHAGWGAFSIAAGDFNRDGALDLAVTNWGYLQEEGSGIYDWIYFPGTTVSVLFGQGDGTFAPRLEYPAGVGPVSVAAGDVNGDGNLDLAVVRSPWDTPGGTSVLLGDGGGGFDPPRDVVGGASYVTLADVTGDGHLDLVQGGGTVVVVPGNGDGTFRAGSIFHAAGAAWAVAAADLNADGRADLAVAAGLSFVTILLNRGDGSMIETPVFANGSGTYSIVAADFDADGNPDVASANSGSNDVSLLMGRGDGSFQPLRNFPVVDGQVAILAADFNGDGRLDLAMAHWGQSISVLLGNGDGSFQAARNSLIAGHPKGIATGDFNRDGNLDLAVATWGFGPPGSVSVLLGNGDGTFRTTVSYVGGDYPRAVAAGDFNADGNVDLAVGGSSTLAIFLGRGDGTFQPGGTLTLPAAHGMAVADWNRDDRLDLAVAHPHQFGSISLLLGNGDGTFRAPVRLAAGSQTASVSAVDLNGDAKLDLVAANALSFNVSVFLGDGAGALLPAVHFGMGGYGGGLGATAAAADFNRDGKLDVAAANLSCACLSVLINNTP